MKIDVMISAADIKAERLKNKVVVVIDVLRATSVMITALSNGCDKVIPVSEIEDAIEISNMNRECCLLVGERKGLKIEGFDFSNSPLDYTGEVVAGKTLVMTTSNGTRAIKNSEAAERIFIAAIINGNAVARKLIELDKDVVFVNAGTDGEFSMDDYITSGYIISCMKYIKKCSEYDFNKNETGNINTFELDLEWESKPEKNSEYELTDIARTSEYIYMANTDIISFVKDAIHYKRLKNLGYDEDLTYCFTKDIVQIVPEYRDGAIKI